MTNTNLEKKIAELKELKAMAKELDNEISELEHELKNEMTLRNTDQIDIGAHTIRYKKVTSNRFDSKAFKEDFQDIYTEYCKPVSSMRFTIA